MQISCAKITRLLDVLAKNELTEEQSTSTTLAQLRATSKKPRYTQSSQQCKGKNFLSVQLPWKNKRTRAVSLSVHHFLQGNTLLEPYWLLLQPSSHHSTELLIVDPPVLEILPQDRHQEMKGTNMRKY
jgi:hypothetical protein